MPENTVMDTTATIQARTRRQVMDWSLVLTSQGIEPVIERTESGYQLVIPASTYETAVDAIQKYRTENRSWSWRQTVFREGIVFDWISVIWVILVVIFYWINTRFDLAAHGIMDSSAVVRGEWWRPFTAIWLHADIAHLATNATIGLALLGVATARYGMGPTLACACLAGVGGNLFAWLGSTQVHRSLGASGMVMGCLGMLAIRSVAHLGKSPHARKTMLAGLGATLMLFVLLGLSPGSDILAHVGGLISGVFVGACFTALEPRIHQLIPRLLGLLSFVLLIVVPWYFALRHE